MIFWGPSSLHAAARPVAGWPGMRVTPAIPAVVTWAEEAVEALRRRVARRAFGYGVLSPDRPLTLHLEWQDGQVDAAGSRVLTQSPHEIHSNVASPAEIAQLAGTPLAD